MTELASTSTEIRFEDVTVTMGGTHILDHVSAQVPAGGCTAIIGPNGAGKTTLLRALLGEISYKGKIHVGCSRPTCQDRIGYVPQRLAFDRGMPITVLEFMVMGHQRLPLWFGIRQKHGDRARELLTYVKAEKLAERQLGALSGGELQRVLLALALGQNPDLLILDEPAAGVDFHGENLFCELLESLRRDWGFTQVMVTHDLSTVTHHASHVICLNREVAAEGPPQEVLTPENLAAIFGMHMGLVDISAMPAGEGSCSASCCGTEKPDA